MNRLKVSIVSVIILLMAGCTDYIMICSLNPFYVDKNITLISGIEGNWKAVPLKGKSVSGKEEKSPSWYQKDTTSTWVIERVITKETIKTAKGKDSAVNKPSNYYMVKLISKQSDTAAYQFKLVLFRVKNALYADFMPVSNTCMEKSRFAYESYFSVHTLARVVIQNKQVEVSWLGAEYMKEMIEKKRVRVSYRWIDSAKRLLLTGTPEELTGMIERYAGETRFIDWGNQQAMLMLNRIK